MFCLALQNLEPPPEKEIVPGPKMGCARQSPFGLFSACFEQSDTYARSIIQVYMCRLLGTPSEVEGSRAFCMVFCFRGHDAAEGASTG